MGEGLDLIASHFELTPRQLEQFAMMQELYEQWNSKINVISRRDTDNFYERHVLHSLAIAKCGLIAASDRVLDVGCGGGFPVIPLAILYPDVEFTAVDSIGKKIVVVKAVVEALGLTNVTVHNCRVEALEGSWHWVLSRAVAPMGDLISWTDGRFDKGLLFLKGGDLRDEVIASGVDASRVEIIDISRWFGGEFFATKSVIVCRR